MTDEPLRVVPDRSGGEGTAEASAADRPDAQEWDRSGTEVARALLQQAPAAAPGAPGTTRRGGPWRRSASSTVAAGQDADVWSAPGPDRRDPQPVARAVSRLVHDEGWVQPLRDHAVVARWAEAVGAAVAEHAEAVSFEDGCLVVRCRSTAWAVQLRHLRGHVLDRLAAVHGAGVVTRLEVVGPHGPSWRAGRLRVPGRGPRDTYG